MDDIDAEEASAAIAGSLGAALAGVVSAGAAGADGAVLAPSSAAITIIGNPQIRMVARENFPSILLFRTMLRSSFTSRDAKNRSAYFGSVRSFTRFRRFIRGKNRTCRSVLILTRVQVIGARPLLCESK